MLKMVKLLPLLMLETVNNGEPDFFGVFNKMSETLDKMNEKLDRLAPPNQNDEGGQNSPETLTETSSDLVTPAAVEVSDTTTPTQAETNPTQTESNPDETTPPAPSNAQKRYPWSSRKSK